MAEDTIIKNIQYTIYHIKDYMINNNLLNPYIYYELTLIQNVINQKIMDFNNRLITRQQLHETMYLNRIRLNLIGYKLMMR